MAFMANKGGQIKDYSHLLFQPTKQYFKYKIFRLILPHINIQL